MLLIGVVIGFVLATAVYFYKLKSFKAATYEAADKIAAELTSLRKDVVTGVTLVETDFRATEQAIIAFWNRR